MLIHCDLRGKVSKLISVGPTFICKTRVHYKKLVHGRFYEILGRYFWMILQYFGMKIVSRSKSKCYKALKVQKYALNSQLQALQILKNNDEVEN